MTREQILLCLYRGRTVADLNGAEDWMQDFTRAIDWLEDVTNTDEVLNKAGDPEFAWVIR